MATYDEIQAILNAPDDGEAQESASPSYSASSSPTNLPSLAQMAYGEDAQQNAPITTHPKAFAQNIGAGLLDAMQKVSREMPDFSQNVPGNDPKSPVFQNRLAQINPEQIVGLKPEDRSGSAQMFAKLLPLMLMPELDVGKAGGALGQALPRGEQFARNMVSKSAYPMNYGMSQNPQHPAMGAAEMMAPQAGIESTMFAPEIEKMMGSIARPVADLGREAATNIGQGVKGGTQSVMDFFNRDKIGDDYLKSLHPGTHQENLESLAGLINEKGQAEKEAALNLKEPVMEDLGDQDLLKQTRIDLANKNYDKAAKIFNGGEAASPKEAQQFKEAIEGYQKHGDFDKFVDQADDIFKPLKEITPEEESKIDDLMAVSPAKTSSYIKNVPEEVARIPSIQKFSSRYMKNPTFRNADDLQKQINVEVARLKNLSKKGMLDTAGGDRLVALGRAKDAIERDIDRALNSAGDQYAKQYRAYKDYWMQHVLPFRSNANMAKIYQGDKKGWTNSEMKNIFAFPDEDIQKVIPKLGREGQQRILFNALKGKSGAKLGDEIPRLKQDEGYQAYITPEDEMIAEAIRKRNKTLDRISPLKWAGKAVKKMKGA